MIAARKAFVLIVTVLIMLMDTTPKALNPKP